MNAKVVMGIAIVIITIGIASVILADDSTTLLDAEIENTEDKGKVIHVNPKASINTSSGLAP